MRYSSYICNK